MSYRGLDNRSSMAEGLGPFLLVLRAQNRYGPSARIDDLRDDFDQRGLTSTVFSDETVDLSFLDGKTDVFQSILITVFFSESFHF